MPSQETTNALQEERIKNLEKELYEISAHVTNLERDRDSAMRWGLITLGTAVVGLVVWIFNTLGIAAHR